MHHQGFSLIHITIYHFWTIFFCHLNYFFHLYLLYHFHENFFVYIFNIAHCFHHPFCILVGSKKLKCTIHDKKGSNFYRSLVFLFSSLSNNQNVLNILQVNILHQHIFRTINIIHFVPMYGETRLVNEHKKSDIIDTFFCTTSKNWMYMMFNLMFLLFFLWLSSLSSFFCFDVDSIFSTCLLPLWPLMFVKIMVLFPHFHWRWQWWWTLMIINVHPQFHYFGRNIICNKKNFFFFQISKRTITIFILSFYLLSNNPLN